LIDEHLDRALLNAITEALGIFSLLIALLLIFAV